MRSWLALTMTVGTALAFIDEIDKECMDKSPYCNTNDCTVRPGYALEYCRKTCGDCEPFCHNSHFVSCKDSRKPECDSMLKDYCPLLCGACRPIKKKSEKKNGTKSTSRTPLTAVQFSKPKEVLPNTIPAGHGTTIDASDKPLNPSLVERNTVQEEHAASSLVHRSPPILKQLTLNDQKSRETGGEPSANGYIGEPIPSPYSDPVTAMKLNGSSSTFFTYPIVIPPLSDSALKAGHSPWLQPSLGFQHLMPSFPPPPYSYFTPTPHQPYGPRTNPQSAVVYSFPAKFPPNVFYDSTGSAPRGKIDEQPLALSSLITLLGCRDKDPAICSQLTAESCLSRPGFYMKMCPIKCKNCNGLQCLDSVKIDCDEVRRLGGCKLPMAVEYCPRTCRLCATPPALADSLPPCKDELETCTELAESGMCEHSYSRNTMRIYCAKSCEFCREAQYYMNDVYRKSATKPRTNHHSSNVMGYGG